MRWKECRDLISQDYHRKEIGGEQKRSYRFPLDLSLERKSPDHSLV